MAQWGSPNMQEYSRSDCFASHKAESPLSTLHAQETRCAHLGSPDGVYLCSPLILQGELVGVMTVHWNATEVVSDSTALASRLLGDAALALANLRLRKELKEMAIRDSLTGLYNRRHMEEFLNREMGRCNRKRQPLSLILFDVDHFKLFNDLNGHNAGDAVLREVGKLTRQMVRASDIGCRYGGEEFLIILPELEVDSAVKRAELMRRSAEVMRVEYNEKVLPQVTLSLGVASFPLHGDTPEKLVAVADTALYSAKRLGRNRVVLATPGEFSDDWIEPPVKSR
jgi:diguanylate cyclase (GGDEF)-like protein